MNHEMRIGAARAFFLLMIVTLNNSRIHTYSSFSISGLGDPAAQVSAASAGRGYTGMAYHPDPTALFLNAAALDRTSDRSLSLSLEWVPYFERRQASRDEWVARDQHFSGFGPGAFSWSTPRHRWAFVVGWTPRWNLDYGFEQERERDRGQGKFQEGRDVLNVSGLIAEAAGGVIFRFHRRAQIGVSFHRFSGRRETTQQERTMTAEGWMLARLTEREEVFQGRHARAGIVLELEQDLTLGFFIEPSYSVHVTSRTRAETPFETFEAAQKSTWRHGASWGMGLNYFREGGWPARLWLEGYGQERSRIPRGIHEMSWAFRAGVEVTRNPWTFRGGVCVLPRLLVEDPGINWFTVGWGYTWNSMKVDLALTWGQRSFVQSDFFLPNAPQGVEESFRRLQLSWNVFFDLFDSSNRI